MANNLQKIPLPGYMAPGADAIRLKWRGDYFGPALYQAGGNVSFATDYGMVGIEDAGFAFGGVCSNNTYTAKCVMPPSASSNAELYAPTYANMTVQFYYTANSTEVAGNTNLSNVAGRLSVTGDACAILKLEMPVMLALIWDSTRS